MSTADEPFIESSYYYWDRGLKMELGPLGPVELIMMRRRGQLTDQSKIRVDTEPDWQTYAEIFGATPEPPISPSRPVHAMAGLLFMLLGFCLIVYSMSLGGPGIIVVPAIGYAGVYIGGKHLDRADKVAGTYALTIMAMGVVIVLEKLHRAHLL